MERANVKVRRWGNSLGIIIPSNIIKNQSINENSEIEIMINLKSKTKAGDIFGILKGKLKRSTEDLLNEVNKDFEK
jgi:antitoxin component of MazEF toxin-antitoxin module